MTLRGYYGSNPNIISRILEPDLPIASNLVNMSSCCAKALRLQKIDNDTYQNIN